MKYGTLLGRQRWGGGGKGGGRGRGGGERGNFVKPSVFFYRLLAIMDSFIVSAAEIFFLNCGLNMAVYIFRQVIKK
jgi:hypothetical protein